jgi:hypothetical protein
VLDPAAVDATIAGTDVVLSALGARGFGATNVYSAGAANIIAAMKAHGASRLLAVSSVGVEEDPGAPFLLKRVLAPLFLRNVLADMRLMEREIENSGLVWTIVRPVRLDGRTADRALSRRRALHSGERPAHLARRRRRLHGPGDRRRTHDPQDRRARVLNLMGARRVRCHSSQ